MTVPANLASGQPCDRAADGPARERAKQTLANPSQAAPMVGVVGGQMLHGGLEQAGVSIEWNEFEVHQPLEWSRQLHPDCLELCLNMSGHGSIRFPGIQMAISPLTAAFYVAGTHGLGVWRQPGSPHQFVSVQFSRRFLTGQLAPCDGALHPLVEAFVQGTSPRQACGVIRRLDAEHERLAGQLQHPPGNQGARRLWYRSKVLQLMADFFFERQGADELFCDRQKRIARERVELVIALLQANFVEPPGLPELGRKVGCSPFHLSRTFSAEAGMTIPQYLRKLRMERAAELLRSGRYNVTETALEVGYSSLSHFSQVFCQTMGCCPGLYPLKAGSDAAESGTPCSKLGEQSTIKESQSTRSAIS